MMIKFTDGRVIRVMEEKLCGTAGDGEIIIDNRERGKSKMDTIIHETLHEVFEDMEEDDVSDAANNITEVLWAFGYRLRRGR